VGTPSIMPAFCLVMAGYVGMVLGSWGDAGAIGRGMMVALKFDLSQSVFEV